MNIVNVEGLLTRFEEKTTNNGNRVCAFSILLPEKPPADGQPRKDGTFVAVESWDVSPQLAALLAKSVKNCRVFVKGRLRLDRWKDKETGANRQELKVIGDVVSFKPLKRSKGYSGGGSKGNWQQRNAQRQPQPAPQYSVDNSGNEIPF